MFTILDQRKQAKILWLQDPNQTNVRREVGRHVGNKKKECLKANINDLETDSKLKKY